jgi:hypothetical protein
MDAAVPMDAKNAPTETWKTAGERGFPQASTRIVVSLARRSDKRLTHKIPDTPQSAMRNQSAIRNQSAVRNRRSTTNQQSPIPISNHQSVDPHSAVTSPQSSD